MKRHEFDPLSFVFGALLAAVGLAVLLGGGHAANLHLRWVWPVLLLGLGVIMLVAASKRSVRPPEVPPRF